jgi:hypothetical protein
MAECFRLTRCVDGVVDYDCVYSVELDQLETDCVHSFFGESIYNYHVEKVANCDSCNEFNQVIFMSNNGCEATVCYSFTNIVGATSGIHYPDINCAKSDDLIGFVGCRILTSLSIDIGNGDYNVYLDVNIVDCSDSCEFIGHKIRSVDCPEIKCYNLISCNEELYPNINCIKNNKIDGYDGQTVQISFSTAGIYRNYTVELSEECEDCFDVPIYSITPSLCEGPPCYDLIPCPGSEYPTINCVYNPELHNSVGNTVRIRFNSTGEEGVYTIVENNQCSSCGLMLLSVLEEEDCCHPCNFTMYSLTDCRGVMPTIYTKMDLSGIVGKIVKIPIKKNTCYLVEEVPCSRDVLLYYFDIDKVYNECIDCYQMATPLNSKIVKCCKDC